MPVTVKPNWSSSHGPNAVNKVCAPDGPEGTVRRPIALRSGRPAMMGR